MRIFILAPDAPPATVLQALVTRGVEPIVAHHHGTAEDDGAVRHVRITARGDAHDPMDLRWSRKSLRTAVRDARPALLHIVGDPWTPTAEAGAAAARDLGIPYVLVGTASVGGPGGITARWQAKRVREGAVALAGITRPALDHLARGETDRPVGVTPSGGITVPTHLVRRPRDGGFTIGAVGRLTRERGYDVLLDALGDTYGTWRLKVIGTGPEQEALEGQAQRLGLSARIEWLGAVSREQVTAEWGSVDALAAPSRVLPHWVEPSGQVVLEAMAHGVAPVVTRSGALPDVVGDAGEIIEPDDAAALSAVLQAMVEQPVRASILGDAARQRVLERYGDVAIAERMVVLWQKALGRR